MSCVRFLPRTVESFAPLPSSMTVRHEKCGEILLSQEEGKYGRFQMPNFRVKPLYN
jgi:hypothetical protein